MKLIKTLALLFMTGMFVISCQKEYSEENGGGGSAAGTLKAAGTGECLPSSVQGIYLAGTALTAANFIDVDVDFTAAGTYLINTDIVNGYSYTGVGIATSTGVQTIRLQASGTPTAAGANTFTVAFGTSECNIVVDVLSAGTGAATATLAGAPGTCSGASLAGTYKVNTPMTPSNSVTLSVNVTAIGTYSINVPASNGISFSGSGAFTTTGAHTVTLAASGSPVAAGTFNSAATYGASSSACTFSVTTVAGGGGGPTAAVYTLGGAPTECTGATLAGTYQAAVSMTATNKVTLNVNVTTAGTYTITTTAVNGVTFSGTGTFAATGAQTAVLTATGLPAAAGAFNFPATGLAGNTCPFSVTFAAPPPPAVFTLGGAPGACSGATTAGTYTVNSALGASNTVTISANVTTAGVYSVTTNTDNGMSFSANAVFSGTAAQTITLVGSGTPLAAGTFNFTATAGASTCTFSVTVVAAPTGIYSCKINGVFSAFTTDAKAEIQDDAMGKTLYLNGYSTPPFAGADDPQFQIFITKIASTAVPGVGTYNTEGLTSPTNQHRLEIDYTLQNPDMSTTIWNTSSTIMPPPNPAFTVSITQITATRVKGTFSGKITNIMQGSTIQKTVTEGVFDLPIL